MTMEKDITLHIMRFLKIIDYQSFLSCRLVCNKWNEICQLFIFEIKRENMITNDGLQHVPNLKILDLWNNNTITNDGLRHVPNLKVIDLWNNNTITNNGLRHVPNLKT